jgi:hypothetical protein
MYTITMLIQNLFLYNNPNYIHHNNYKVKTYNTIETNKYNPNFKLLSRININYDRYKLSTFIKNNNTINNYKNNTN